MTTLASLPGCECARRAARGGAESFQPFFVALWGRGHSDLAPWGLQGSGVLLRGKVQTGQELSGLDMICPTECIRSRQVAEMIHVGIWNREESS